MASNRHFPLPHMLLSCSALIASKEERPAFQLAIIIIVIIMALVAQVPLMVKVHTVEYDEAIFLDVANNIRRTGLPLRSIGEEGAFFFDHTFLYVYLLSAYAGGGVFFTRLVTALCGMGSILLVYLIGKRVGGLIAGFTSALMLAVNSFFAVYSFFVRMEIPTVFCMLLGLLLLIESKLKRGLLLGAGITLAVAALLKEVALLFIAMCGVYLLLVLRRSEQSGGKALLFAVPAIVGMGAWGIISWKLSPSGFIGAIHRWWVSAAGGNVVRDPRMSLTFAQWGQRIVFDLLDVGLVALFFVALLFFVHRKPTVLDCILLGYPVFAIALSFVIRLKEPRHLIGVLPISALFVGVNVDWGVLLKWIRGSRLRAIIGTIVVLVLLFLASPLRIPVGNVTNPASWLDPLYAWRLFENDRYYNVLRLAGLYLRDHTDPNEVITVLHEATVTAYYADRHYYMLYTAPFETVMRTLDRTRYLVWDHEVFLALTEEQVQAVREYVEKHFAVEKTIHDEYRQVIIYRRLDS